MNTDIHFIFKSGIIQYNVFQTFKSSSTCFPNQSLYRSLDNKINKRRAALVDSERAIGNNLSLRYLWETVGVLLRNIDIVDLNCNLRNFGFQFIIFGLLFSAFMVKYDRMYRQKFVYNISIAFLSPSHLILSSPKNITKSDDLSLETKGKIISNLVFLLTMYRCKSWTVKKAYRGKKLFV